MWLEWAKKQRREPHMDCTIAEAEVLAAWNQGRVVFYPTAKEAVTAARALVPAGTVEDRLHKLEVVVGSQERILVEHEVRLDRYAQASTYLGERVNRLEGK